MSIDRETFETASAEKLEGLSAPDLVLGLLATHDDQAFKTRVVAVQAELDEGVVSTALSRLKQRGLVEHKATYWAITTDESRLEEYSGYERVTAVLNEQLGAEARASWREHAPDEPHPSVEDDR